jgi:DNA-binding MarR family transcriptional regulator
VASAASSDNGAPTLLYLIGRADRVVRRAIGEVLEAHGLSVNEYTTLSVLHRRGGLSNAQLARRALVSPQSMHGVLLCLEERELVQRSADPNHGRIRRTELTRKGLRLLHACDEHVRDVEDRMVGDLSPAERTTLREGLIRGVRALHGGLDLD